MEHSSGANSSDMARGLAAFLDELGARDPVALDVTGQSSFADCFVIAGAASQAQLRGLQRRLAERLDELDRPPRQRPRRDDESGWLLLDCDDIVIHLMLDEQRQFYELEKLWFDAETLYPASSPTDSVN